MSKELVPERRVNKLGHVVTKHVRTSDGSAKSSKLLPTVLSLAGDREMKLTILTARFAGRHVAISGLSILEAPSIRPNIRSVMSEFSDLTLGRLESIRPNVDGVIAELLLAKHDEHTINDFIAVVDVLERSLMPMSQIEKYLWSLRVTSELLPQGESGEYPSERGEQCIALVRVMRDMEQRQLDRLFRRDEHVSEYPFISDDNLRRLVINAGPDRESVVSMIIDRELLDADHITELVKDVHPSLMEGGL